MPTNTYVALDKITVGTATSTITFSAIPSTYTDLILVANISNTSTSASDATIRYNGDTGANYSRTQIYGSGTAASSTRDSNQTSAYMGGYFSNQQSAVIIHFMNYANTSVFKTAIARANTAERNTNSTVTLWRNTAAINSITYLTTGGSFAVGSTFSLYGISNAGDASPKATGGDVYSDANYWYHAFTMSGNFVPNQSLTADILVVAGGGSGSGGGAGGGGAGGLLAFTSQSLTTNTYTCIVGAGAAGSSGANYNGNNGNDSQFGSLTLVKGGGRGGQYYVSGTAQGGTGGSGGGSFPNATGTTAGGLATSGQGNAGGSGSTDGSTYRSAGGGGGAGAAGGNGNTSAPQVSGKGGDGVTTYSSWGAATSTGENISGTYWYAGGGGGANGTVGAKGNGGGSAGNATGVSANGLANTGGGSGGGGSSGGNFNSGSGGSGVIIVRYAK